MPPIYLDNAATTRVHDDVLALMTDVMRNAWGNPSSPHPHGAAARAHVETARTRLLAALGDRAGRGDIIWTSGCTESDVLALTGAVRVRGGGALAVSAIEHAAVSHTAARLAGDALIRVAPGSDGVIDPDAMADAARGAAVVAIVMVQNEIGVVQPVAAICEAVRRANPTAHLHVDAAQAFGKVPIDVATLGADSVALAAHKLHGPKGVGALWLRGGVALEPLWVGGGHQKGMRGGTQDTAGVAGFGLAAERAVAAIDTMRARWLEFAGAVTSHIGGAASQLVPDRRRSPHILALGVPGVPAGALRTVLASRGVYVSTGSACHEGGAQASAVLGAIGLAEDAGMVRLSFSHDTTAAEIDAAAAILADVIHHLRKPG